MTHLKKLAALVLFAAITLNIGCGEDKTTPAETAPDPVTNLRVSATTDTTITLTWEYPAGASIDNFVIRRNNQEIARPAKDVRTFTDRGLTANTSYTYSVVAVKGSRTSAASSITQTTSQPPVRRAELAGSIIGTRTLSKDTIYTLKGFVIVQPDGILIIPAGTRIEGDFQTQGALLTVKGAGTPGQSSYRRSGRIIAEGTAQEPIVFTSQRPVGQRRRGDWGGIVLNGLGCNNGSGGTLIGEGNTGAHGGNLPTDTSGILRYVRVEFGGTKITPDNEINGFTFNSVGNGTVLEYLQAHYIADDAFEWFGGNVNCRYLVATGCDDDHFDMDNGYNGKIQFGVVVEDRGLANRGYEVNNDGQGSSNRSSAPVNSLTSPIVYNVTMVGAGVARANDDNNDGMYLRGNSQGQYWNQIVVNFGGFGVVVDGSGSITQYQNDSLQVRNSIFANRGLLGLGNPAGPAVGPGVWGAFRRSGTTGYDTVDATSGLNFFTKSAGRGNRNFTSSDGILRNVNYDNPMNGTKPDLRPAANSPALTGAANPTQNPLDQTARYPGDETRFFQAVDFIGAMKDVDWTEGWTTWAIN